jgi:hypothetical protein
MRRRDRTEGAPPDRSTGSLTEQARDMSVSAVRVATDTARAMLDGMQELGRAMADMAPSAARRAVTTAGEVTRATVDGARRAAPAPPAASRPSARKRRSGRRRAA